MPKTAIPALLMLVAATAACHAAPSFACKASGDAWSITGTSSRKMACTLRCVLRDAGGNQDAVSCAPVVSPEGKADPVCEGFTIGRHWASASLVAAECAATGP